MRPQVTKLLDHVKLICPRCGCPDGFTFQLVLNECEDANECNGDSSNNPCGNARCHNTYGSFSCLCPAGYSYDHRRQICIQSAAGCAEAPCAFGCLPVMHKT